ncbi:hypothetical protein J6590_066341 [Homalodisca vitripennis]|nr:hypothetical protein J6590_066341 [Homalodisca vitripennis]
MSSVQDHACGIWMFQSVKNVVSRLGCQRKSKNSKARTFRGYLHSSSKWELVEVKADGASCLQRQDSSAVTHPSSSHARLRDSASSNPVCGRCTFYQYLVFYRLSPLFCLIKSSPEAHEYGQNKALKEISFSLKRDCETVSVNCETNYLDYECLLVGRLLAGQRQSCRRLSAMSRVSYLTLDIHYAIGELSELSSNDPFQLCGMKNYTLGIIQLTLPSLDILDVVLYCQFKCVSLRGIDVHQYGTRGRDNFRMAQHRTTVFELLPSQVGVRLINRLPEEIKRVNNHKQFKSRLKHFLVSKAFYSVDEFAMGR